jgi:hypothetical protein
VPVHGERGNGGGYRLLDGYRTTPRGLRRRKLGALSPRVVAADAADGHGWVEQMLLFDGRGVAVAALLALSPEVVIMTPEDLRNDLILVAMEMVEQQPSA